MNELGGDTNHSITDPVRKIKQAEAKMENIRSKDIMIEEHSSTNQEDEDSTRDLTG